MKLIRTVQLLLPAFLLLMSCQQEFMIDDMFPAAGSLRDDASGNCLGNVVNGNYRAATATTASNTISIQVAVSAAGSYQVHTDTINGYYFKATGTFAATGIQTVQLRAAGTPLAEGIDNFTVFYDSSSCEVAVAVLPASGGPGTDAVFTLAGAGASCTGAVIDGTYKVGTALGSANQVSIEVNVTSIGAYAISTSAVNGMSFSASGSFTATGVQTVVLTGSGTPVAAGSITVPVSSGGNQCSFAVNVQPASTANAVFTLVSAGTTCSNASFDGTYAVNSALGADHTATLQVNVTTAGAWTVSSATVNGISFSGSGVFTATGTQSITLDGSGTPTTAGANTIAFTAGSSNCNFSLTVGADPNVPSCNPANNTAEFSSLPDISFYAVNGGPFGGAYKITGNGSGGDVTFEFADAVEPPPGVYRIQSVAGSFVTGDVRVSFVNQNIYWQSHTGSVFVTVANGKVTAVLCDVSFSGSLGGPSYTTIVDAKVTETN